AGPGEAQHHLDGRGEKQGREQRQLRGLKGEAPMEREQATKFIYDLLRALIAKKGSDLFITSGFPPAMKIDSKMTPVSQTALTAQHTAMLCRAVMNDKQAAEFEAKKECNFAIAPAGIGRFRVNTFVQQGQVGMVMRVIT